ncbi:hypothetical protein FJTKL_04048 [Diaporthe vaccinii]|uniref:Uncharacterized protein n=1 Tax=Diaporthe vaccinii TaxID=105482 RepID=A0ABR4DX20_9PEZI
MRSHFGTHFAYCRLTFPSHRLPIRPPHAQCAYPTIPNVSVDSFRRHAFLLSSLLLSFHSTVLELEDVVSP